MQIKSHEPAVIVGGGIAGLAVAVNLARNGFESVIVERRSHIGGNVRQWACTAVDQCLRCFCCRVEDLVDEVRSSDKVTVLGERELGSIENWNDSHGDVVVRSPADGAEETIAASSLVLATGFEPYDPTEKIFWGYGRLDGVLTLVDLNALVRRDETASLQSGVEEPVRLAFFQCVGSRDRSVNADYCSRHCCKSALRMALRLKHEYQDWEITVFYIDLQVAGKFAGRLLSEAEERGIRLIQGVPGEILEGPNKTLEVIREENRRNVRESFHKIILSVGQRAPSDMSGLAERTGIPLDEFGFAASVDAFDSGATGRRGIYAVGACSGPKDIEQTLHQAGKTASLVMAGLLKGVAQ